MTKSELNCESRRVPRSCGPKAESGEMHCCPRHEQALLSSSILNSRTRALDAHNPAQQFRCPDEENGLFPQKITSIGRRDDGSDLPRRISPRVSFEQLCADQYFCHIHRPRNYRWRILPPTLLEGSVPQCANPHMTAISRDLRRRLHPVRDAQ